MKPSLNFKSDNKKKYLIYINIILVAALPGYFLLLASFVNSTQEDTLPSWKDTKIKTEIMDFVERVTKEGNAEYIAPQDRIAVFDNDGTLWQEQPTVEAMFVRGKIKDIAEKNPSLKNKQPYKAILEGNEEYFQKGGLKSILEATSITHANMTQEEFRSDVQKFLDTAMHPKYKLPYTQLTYQPMVELLIYLRNNGFQTWICSGGSTDFMRVFSEVCYGVPPQQVIGSTNELQYIEKNGQWLLWRTNEMASINDKTGKPVGISNRIGKKPVIVCGNVKSGGDVAMLTYSQGITPCFQMLINHDDAVREFSYQEKDNESLNAAKKNGWRVVSMKNDWNSIFGNGQMQVKK